MDARIKHGKELLVIIELRQINVANKPKIGVKPHYGLIEHAGQLQLGSVVLRRERVDYDTLKARMTHEAFTGLLCQIFKSWRR
jgi:hypothetical protein